LLLPTLPNYCVRKSGQPINSTLFSKKSIFYSTLLTNPPKPPFSSLATLRNFEN
jgi:hypothetical protein